MGWFPPSSADPLPVTIVEGATDPGVSTWYPPSWQNPLPVTIVAGDAGPGGTITAVLPGTGLVGGGNSGDVTLALEVPVPVALGGTGAVTAAAALTNLGAVPLPAGGNPYDALVKQSDGSVAWRSPGDTGNENARIGSSGPNPGPATDRNIAIGSGALAKLDVMGSSNVSVGAYSLYNVNGVFSNTAIGHGCFYRLTAGGSNVGAGTYAGTYLNDATTPMLQAGSSVFIGSNTYGGTADNQTNQVVIGFGAQGHGSNTITLGNPQTKALYIGNVGADTASASWLAGTNPDQAVLVAAPRAMTITNVTGVIRVSEVGASLQIKRGDGTNILSAAFDLGRAPGIYPLTVGISALAAGDYLYLSATGAPFISSIAHITVALA